MDRTHTQSARTEFAQADTLLMLRLDNTLAYACIVVELKQYSKCVQVGTVYHAPACPGNCASFLCLVSTTKDVLILACLCIVCVRMYMNHVLTYVQICMAFVSLY